MEQLEHPGITAALQTGYPLQSKHKERDDVDVIEVAQEEYTQIVMRRKDEKGLHKG